ncbi:hypothetical protein JAO73_03775 [Hymenobacter sp. BT523]|uniref:hypothetical protein n=1 Tax=Hymenobacter sp. BT523 TaxID=2795725 RepID=UPI0018EBC16A|nr:hypothetical protein [Hymenobacter sp. BT523]MBJ6108117.1 hypothetical protein [Hymenobacter sp. BT523]
MSNQICGNDFRKIGYPAGPAIGCTLDVLAPQPFSLSNDNKIQPDKPITYYLA